MHKRQVKRLQLLFQRKQCLVTSRVPQQPLLIHLPQNHTFSCYFYSFVFFLPKTFAIRFFAESVCQPLAQMIVLTYLKKKKCNNQKGQWLVKGGKHKKTKARCTHMSVKQGSQLDEGPGLANPCCKNGRIAFPQCISSCESIVYRACQYARHYTQHFTCIV